MKRDAAPVVIVGAGLSGLCCARRLQREGIPWTLVERDSRVGGRVQTDEHDGYLLDRGFQVFLTSYPEARRTLDYGSLELRSFYPGALTYAGGKFLRVANPRFRPLDALAALGSPVFGAGDALRVVRMVLMAPGGDASRETTAEYLRRSGFSERCLERFFRPFFSGVLLDRSLSTPRSTFDFVFRMFATGRATLPSRGMQAIPQQIASGLPPQRIRLDCPVVGIEDHAVTLETGESIEARAVVVATDGLQADRLLRLPARSEWNATTTLYYAAFRPPIERPILVLNGTGRGSVNHVCVPSLVAPGYAPRGRSLIAVSLLGLPEPDDASLADRIAAELEQWFGAGVRDWDHLRTYAIPRALPRTGAPSHPRVATGLYACGDHLEHPSINGAMLSGRRAAEGVIEDMTQGRIR